MFIGIAGKGKPGGTCFLGQSGTSRKTSSNSWGLLHLNYPLTAQAAVPSKIERWA